MYVHVYTDMRTYMYMFLMRDEKEERKKQARSYTWQLIFLRKSDYIGCAVLLCPVVCLTLLAYSFLPSHLSLKHVHEQTRKKVAKSMYGTREV